MEEGRTSPDMGSIQHKIVAKQFDDALSDLSELWLFQVRLRLDRARLSIG